MKDGSKSGAARQRLASRMLRYFTEFDGEGAPSFEKFARISGCRVAEFCAYREDEAFDRVYRECNEIRRDYLIDQALCRRYDPSFVKFLLTEESEAPADEKSLALTLEVVSQA